MRVKIYQINLEHDVNNVGFMAYERLKRLQGNVDIDSRIYDLVYEKDVFCNNLEDIFRIFNIERPEDFRGHSLSVSDIVEVINSDTIESGFYFCDSIGFKEVSFDAKKCGLSERFNKGNTYMSIDERIHNSASKTIDHRSASKKELNTPDFER